MRIAIDATSIPPKPAGAGVYAIELARALMQRDRRDGYALYMRGHWLDEDAAGRPNWRIEHVDASSRRRRLIWEQTRLPGVLRSLGIEVLHSTHHTLPLLGVSCARIVTIHDLTFMRIPKRYPPARRLYMQTLTRLSARTAGEIIVPSNAIRDDVVRLLHAPASKVTTIYEAAGSRFQPIEAAESSPITRRYGLDRPYVLSVGSLEPGKNRSRLMRAMRSLRSEGLDFALAIAGQRAWNYGGDFELVDELNMGDRVMFLGYVPDDDLPALYSASTAFAFPSLYEGFGLPVLEAMACGTAVLTSNISATAEVAADAALLVDPRSVETIREGLRQLLTDDELRNDLAARGLKRAAEFSWERAAAETHAVYARAAATRRNIA